MQLTILNDRAALINCSLVAIGYRNHQVRIFSLQSHLVQLPKVEGSLTL